MLSELPYVAFLAAILVLVPLPWYWRAKNVATLSLMAWLFVVNVIYGVDSILWHDSVVVVVPVWCDITTRIIIGAQMALPAACMCICIHLEQVASGRQARTLRSEKQRRQIIEAVLCFLVPVVWMALHYTVQGHRFDIIEGYGCRPNTYVSIPAIIIIWVPPLVLATITLIYAALAFHYFLRRRITFAKYLESSGLTTSRYLRLMLMSVVLMVMGVVSTSFTLWYSSLSLRPWTGWASVHSDFSRIAQFPLVLVSVDVRRYYYVIWMIIPVSSFIFFLFFAFGRDAMLEYRAFVAWIRRSVLSACSFAHNSSILPSVR
ncbi:fungal pheromone STE3G-protein-coupled receptor [Sparassis latifolia]